MPVEEFEVPILGHAARAPGASEREQDPDRPLDLGPNAAAIHDLLERTGLLSSSERRHLGEIAAWRWWPVTMPVGGESAGARAAAVLLARGAGRGRAVMWLEEQAAAVVRAQTRSADALVIRAVANAGLALLARDLITEDVFDSLYGPWREVTHR